MCTISCPPYSDLLTKFAASEIMWFVALESGYQFALLTISDEAT